MAMKTIPNHAHCRMCGRAIPADETICSKECQNDFEEQQQKRKRMMWIMYGLLGLGIALLLLGPLFGAGGA